MRTVGGRQRSVAAEDQIDRVDTIDAMSICDDENGDKGLGALHSIRSRTRSRTNETVIGWTYNDPDNPQNWSNTKKSAVVFISGLTVINSTMGSALPSMAIPKITDEWGVTSPEQSVLPISVYLIGYVFGPIIWGPLSEQFGRRNLSIAAFSVFSLFTMACALAPNWPSFLVFRFFCGITGSCPIAVVAGILADIYGEPRTRGRAFAIFMVTTVFGPLFAPIVSGFCSSSIGWRWTFWIALIVCGVTFVMIILLPETFGPILLARRAARMRAANPSARVVAPRDLESTDLNQLLTVVLTRPIRMLISEPIVSTTCAYLALCYGIFYMSFQAFPIIFQQLYGLSPGVTGLCYLPIGVGAILSLPVFWYWDHFLALAVSRGKTWTKREELRRLPLACVGGPSFVIALFWLGWSAQEGTSFVVPMLAGIPFGFGFQLIFMALLNYLTDAYDSFAASANAVASMCRSLLAVVLPLATSHMFNNLGISGACSLLGGLTAVMCAIPFVFIWKGPDIRARSKFCIALRERREELARKAEEERLRAEYSGEGEKEQAA
ncbi:major facilitator superfamily domain-containing protein [Emericellopsis atlantica]|uniref:Major facilitator superfamily domain-containing protein n=1 Tax=Emericellopsis atlantica TaxID=2614577 RepID=A0A9P7ZU54_9HYPO|nr:major facilitator superfamily domain-containing protein [Emericellopsis atlantica]KAG9257688.1 major facilitator superfamily domain-containing protein [Emericellopsis atlantica]